jgi:hemoglobin-like flavoprotein
LKLPVIDLSNEILLSGRMRGSIFTSFNMMNYLVPELYNGGFLSNKSDQYYLGLLALELLNGEPSVTITCFADIEKLRLWFDEPSKDFREWRAAEPRLAPIIAKSLQKRPEDRWSSMEEIASKLRAVRDERWQEDIIKTSYSVHCEGKTNFYRLFYKRFFDKQPKWRTFFRKHKISMARQYKLLDEAVASLANFHIGPEPTSLSHVARVHANLQLSREQYAMFTDSFLESISEMGEKDEDTQRAWRWLFNRGTNYLLMVAAEGIELQAG